MSRPRYGKLFSGMAGILVLRAGAERLREFGIEEHAADAGNRRLKTPSNTVRPDLILAEAELYEVAQEPTARREPELIAADLPPARIGGGGALQFRNATIAVAGCRDWVHKISDIAAGAGIRSGAARPCGNDEPHL